VLNDSPMAWLEQRGSCGYLPSVHWTYPCRDGGTGRRTRLKIERRKAWGFESPSRYVRGPQRFTPLRPIRFFYAKWPTMPQIMLTCPRALRHE